MPIMTIRRTLATLGVIALIAAGTLTYTTLHSRPNGRTYPPARTRASVNFTACLVTPAAGTGATPQSQAVYNGLLKAQTTTNIRVQTFETQGPDNASDAQTAVNTLALRGCNLVTAATPAESAAIELQAHLFPSTRFAIVGATKPDSSLPTNITIEPAGSDSQVTAEISQLTTSTLAHHS
jgi:basic membrane lipoprotein Med (substrate-binding protein (PBP1-ABC) superfamily)